MIGAAEVVHLFEMMELNTSLVEGLTLILGA